ncbi:MAG: hypothetical protein EZS28_010077 [Streblomastix strix]|uniref:Uncharacterized protein n=1 Tax=Streblomastix strix TaxID=222440 RepID=A0A5J4WI65_9EUKA|nr:MAG: hypothetical protein EZS28_010077 [Streblomastix strix]
MKDHNIILHLAPFFVQFVSQSHLNKKIIQQQSDSFDQSFLSSSINLIHNLINNTEACRQIANTPNFLNSLIKLTQFNFNNGTNKEEDNQSLQIRNKSRSCLDIIHTYGDEQVQVELVTNGYPRVLVNVINTAGGSEQQDDWEIKQGLESIIKFIYVILEGRYNRGRPFPPQPVLFKSCQEQFEDEGENEEIEAQLVNKGKRLLKGQANLAKEMILNIFIEMSNT